MNFFNVKFLESDTNKNEYKVRYCVNVRPGVVRRTVATFSNGVLSRDSNNIELISYIKGAVNAK